MSTGRRSRAWILGAGVLLVGGLLVVGRSRRAVDGDGRPEVFAPEGRVRVEVLNAGGVTGLARRATITLRDLGFDVVRFANAESFDRDSSVVIDRVGRTDAARAVANALGIPNVLSQPDPNLYVDVSVLLGRQWSGTTGGGAGTEMQVPRAWWDPRGWLGR